MIAIRFSRKEGCDVSGTPAELRAVAKAIEGLDATNSGVRIIPADLSGAPAPYQRLLKSLHIGVSAGPVKATVDEDTLRLEAGREFIACMASYFDFDDDAPDGYHHHREHWEGNDYVASGSIPLVIMVQRRNE